MQVTEFSAELRRRHGIWTDDYCLRHCEGYRVRGHEGTVGIVEEVWLSPRDGTVGALLVRRIDDYATVTVPPELVDGIDSGTECVRISRLDA